MSVWVFLIIFLILSATLLPLLVLRSVVNKSGEVAATWKVFLFVIAFDTSFAPYAFITVYTGLLEDLIYFFLVWTLFYFTRLMFPAKLSIVAPIFCGIMLVTPASTFVLVSGDHITFYNPVSILIGGTLGGHGWFGVVVFVLYKLAWGLIPLIATHYLMLSTEKDMENKGPCSN